MIAQQEFKYEENAANVLKKIGLVSQLSRYAGSEHGL
jgi:hypothetical protein